MLSRSWSHLRRHLVAYVALFFALTGGTAYALRGSNTVFSDDIVNQHVRSADVDNNGLTGQDVREPSLAKVPGAANADSLGGFPASEYDRPSSVGQTFSGSLDLALAGIGTFEINCQGGDTPNDDGDDGAELVFTNQLGDDAIVGFGLQGSDLGDPVTNTRTLTLDDGTGVQLLNSIRTVYADLVVTPTGSGPVATFHASAQQLPDNSSCLGVVHGVRAG